MKSRQVKIQIGKNGLTNGTLEILENCFETRESVKISVLKSAGHDKRSVKEIAEKIQKELGNHYTYRIIGFTISLRKWRKARG